MCSSKSKETPGLEAGEEPRRGGQWRGQAGSTCDPGGNFGLDAKCWGKPLTDGLTSQELLPKGKR